MSWGEELWDQFGAVLKHTSDETDELNSVIGKFVKERGEVEKEYARKLRKLVERFTPKEKKKEEEPTVAKGLR